MVRNGRIYVNSIDLGIFEQFFVIGKSFGNPVLIGNFIKAILIPLTNSYDLRIWVALVNGNELGSKTETDNGNSGIFNTHNSFI